MDPTGTTGRPPRPASGEPSHAGDLTAAKGSGAVGAGGPPGALATDLYELNMAASYLAREMTAPATFSLFVRRLPARRAFLVAAGLDDCLSYLENFHFTDDDLAHLGAIGFSEETVRRFSRVRFTGEVRAIPEGRIAYASEPLVEVTAPIAEAQLVETILLNQITFQTAVASKAARCRIAAQGRIDLVEFGLRRAHGVEAAMAAARAAAITGFVATSNVAASRHYGLNAAGTMAHSYVQAFSSEQDAFHAFAADLPSRVTLLVDTYDTMRGVRRAIEVIKDLGLERSAGVRLDSGDLIQLSFATRAVLDEAGLDSVRIFVSGNIDEDALAAMVAARAPINAAGVGTRLDTSADAPYLDTAYKLVEYAGRPVAKLSPGKVTYPGAKQVFRSADGPDILALRDEEPPAGSEGLLVKVMEGGRRCGGAELLDPAGAVAAAGVRFASDIRRVSPAARRLDDPLVLAPAVSPGLERLCDEVYERSRRTGGGFGS